MASLFVYWQMLPAALRRWLARLGLIGAVLALAFTAHQIDKRAAVREAHRAGVDECEAAHREAVEMLNRQLTVLADQANAAAVDLMISMQEREELERRLDDEARNDPDAGALGPDRVQRLNAIR